MRKPKPKTLNLRITLEEDAILSAFAEQTGRTKSDIMREAIRALKIKKTPKSVE